MAIHAPDTSLSANDKRILSAIFDPESLPSSVAANKSASLIDDSLPSLASIPESQLSTLEAQQNDIIRTTTSTSSVADFDSAITQQDDIIASNPTYPSAYLNRAMLRRLKAESEAGVSEAPSDESDSQPRASLISAPSAQIDAILSDIARAIQNALPSSSSNTLVSTYQARILRTAYSHRAYIQLKAAEQKQPWRGKSATQLEEAASGDFAAAAKFGDEVAREMSVRTNPYARMCGAIVRNAMEEEIREYS